jgi:glycosyl transferase family 25
MEFIDKIVYINLDRRTDRRQDLESDLTRLGCHADQVIRFPAIEHSEGWIGCTRSHHAVLQLAKSSGWSNVLILEDDFMPVVPPQEFQHQVRTFLESEQPYDVLFFSYNLIQKESYTPQMGRTTDCQTASGYLVHSRFYDTLLQTFSEACTLAEQHPAIHWKYTVDQYWKKLQANRNYLWLYFQTRLGKQRPGFSDLGGHYVDNGV